MTDNSYFNIYELKLSITSLFSVQIKSYLAASDMIYSDVIDSFISEILKYELSVIQSSSEKPEAVLITPKIIVTHPSWNKDRHVLSHLYNSIKAAGPRS